MPTICQFSGVRAATFEIATGELLSGALPVKAKALVKNFILQYQLELEEMWETGQYEKLPPVMRCSIKH